MQYTSFSKVLYKTLIFNNSDVWLKIHVPITYVNPGILKVCYNLGNPESKFPISKYQHIFNPQHIKSVSASDPQCQDLL